MKVFIKEYCRDVTVRIYGVDGEERTKEFFEKYFHNVIGVDIMTDDDRSENLSEAEYSIDTAEQFEFLAQYIGSIQTSIDYVADAFIKGKNESEYSPDGYNYLI